MLNVIKYFRGHSEAYDGIKACSQLHIYTCEFMNTCEYIETSCLYSDLVLLSISKLQYRNSNSYFSFIISRSSS